MRRRRASKPGGDVSHTRAIAQQLCKVLEDARLTHVDELQFAAVRVGLMVLTRARERL